ncbi:MAG: 2-desacetyl-2-hydroxyethyl bacteriochlorophyllide A dehydrogenase [Halioglobus sp.]|jgi:2-desacetyl-2-hydroxyethyl bacteriochlorophyllide A dehydrogenase
MLLRSLCYRECSAQFGSASASEPEPALNGGFRFNISATPVDQRQGEFYGHGVTPSGSTNNPTTTAAANMASIPLARIHGVNDLRLDSIDSPECGEADVLVKVRECGICGSDLTYLAMGGLTGPDTPMPLGHELWGEVSEVGCQVTHLEAGDRVVVQPMSNGNNIGNGGPEGGFSPLLLVRNVATEPGCVLKLPAELPQEYGALVEPMAVAQHGANRIAAHAGDKAVIFGAGPIGLSLVQVLIHRGLKDIVVVDLSEHRLAAATTMGATGLQGDDPALMQKLVELHGANNFFGMLMPGTTVFFEATGVRAVFERIVDTAGPGARICLTGVHKEAAKIDLMMLLAKEVSIVPAMGYEGEFDEVIAMLLSGNLNPAQMVTHHFPLSEITSAFDTAKNTTEAIKVLIDCQS